MNRKHPTKIKVDQHHLKQHYCIGLAFNEEKTPMKKLNPHHLKQHYCRGLLFNGLKTPKRNKS